MFKHLIALLFNETSSLGRRWRLFLASFVGMAIVFAFSAAAQTTPAPSSAHPPLANSAPRSFTIAFWNIQWFPGQRPDASAGEERRQINAVHSEITSFDPDVVGMEEVRNFDKAGLAVQPLRGFKVDVCANFPPREGQNEAQEIAIASRLQPLSAWAEEWKAAGAMMPPRGFAFAAYEIQPRQMLLVYCVHLKSNRGELAENVPIRQESIRQLLAHIAAMEKVYGKLGTITWIIGGDFNTSLDDQRFVKETTLRELLNHGFSWAWQNVPLGLRMTLPPSRDFPATCFDHVFYRGATLRRAFVANTTVRASDHRAIVATFDLPVAGTGNGGRSSATPP
jgi:endonuclease/exonuclease/phosphatase (EEP) superfamily protein YafD